MKKNSILALGLLTLALSVSSFALSGGTSLFHGNEAVGVKAESSVNDIVLSFPDENKNKNKVQNYTSTWTAVSGNQEFKLTNFNNNNWGWNYVKCGNKTAASVGTITTSSAISKVVESVDLEIGGLTANSVNSIYMETSTDGETWANKVALSGLSSGTKTFTVVSPAENLFYKLSFDCKKASANGVVQVNKVTYHVNSTEPAVSVEGGTSIELNPGQNQSYALNAENLPDGSTLEVSVEDNSVAEASINEDKTKLNVAAKTIGSTGYTVSAKDSSGAILASFSGSIAITFETVIVPFGSATGRWDVDTASSTFTDAEGLNWTGTVDGTTSFTSSSGYSQIGSKDNPASSISIKAALENFNSVDYVVLNLGGFSGTAGAVSLKAGSTVIGTGTLNGTSNVAVSSTSSTFADSLSFEISGISKGIKLISMEYAISTIDPILISEVDAFVATYITPYSGEAKEGDSCKTKYENASNAYSSLSEKAKKLFDVHTKYSEAKSVYEYWGSSVNPTNGKGSPLSAAKTADWGSVSSIGVFAIGGAVVLGLFLVNKKKPE